MVVTHGGFLRVLYNLVMKREPKQPFANCGFTEVLCDGITLAFKDSGSCNVAVPDQQSDISFGGAGFG